jgi:3D (Asp-Asp-Asp) domain-containing protein
MKNFILKCFVFMVSLVIIFTQNQVTNASTHGQENETNNVTDEEKDKNDESMNTGTNGENLEQKEEENNFYQDVSRNHWVYDDLLQLIEANVVVRDFDQYFEPSRAIRRGDIIRFVLRAKGIVAPELLSLTGPRFTDVPTELDTYSYIETAYSMAITNGKKEKRFEPLGPTTREESIAMIIRAMGLEIEARNFNLVESSLELFEDANQISANFRPIVAFAVHHGMIKGSLVDEKLYIDPRSYTTRAEAVSMIARFILPETKTLETIDVGQFKVNYHTSLTVEATAYSSEQPNLSNYTSIGLFVRQGIVAVDPSVIPYGTHLYIEGYGFGVAGDKGGAIKGHKIDLAFPTVKEALQYGRKYNVKIYILDNKDRF